MIVFTFNHTQRKWHEVSELFEHDIAILLDERTKQAFFWAGKRVDADELEFAFGRAVKMIEKYKSYELIALDTSTIPLKIQTEIESLMLTSEAREKELLTRTQVMRGVIYTGFLGILFSAIMLLNNFRMLGWAEDKYYQVDIDTFTSVFKASETICLLAIVVFLIQIFLSFGTKQVFLNSTSLTSFMILLGTFFYLGQGILIFNHDPTSTAEVLRLARGSVLSHFIWVIIAFVSSSLCVIISYIALKSRTKLPKKQVIDEEELKLVSRPTILRDKEFTFEKLESTPFK